VDPGGAFNFTIVGILNGFGIYKITILKEKEFRCHY
jgi:hypothetical protein